ncbi:MAG TPA: serine protease [Conexibacter sp.]
MLRIPSRAAATAFFAVAALLVSASAASAAAPTQTLHAEQPPGGAKAPAIVGGTPTPVTQVPWQVFVQGQVDSTHFEDCGGSILDATHVVTAGHCVFNGTTAQRIPDSAMKVGAGISNSQAIEETAQAPIDVATVRVHPLYSFTTQNGGVAPDDVAVLQLATPLRFGPDVQPIALIADGAYPAVGTSAGISGFGRQATGVEPDGLLYSVGTTITDPTSCGVGDANALIDCVSSTTGSACEGDSGGPLTINNTTLAGVASFVRLGDPTGECGVGSFNGYTNLSAPEIQDFVRGNDNPPLAPRGGSDVSATVPPTTVGAMVCKPGTWSNSPTFAYSFVDTRNGQVLQSSASDSYRFTSADVGRTIACQVAATNAGGTGITRTVASRPIRPAPPTPRPLLRLGVRASKARAVKGASVTFAIRTINRGKAAAKSVAVCDTPGRGLSFGKLPKGAKKSHGRACWKLGTLKAGKGATVKIALRVNQASKVGKRVKNAASVSASNGAGKKASATVRVVRR